LPDEAQLPAAPSEAQKDEVRRALPASSEVTNLPFYEEDRRERAVDLGLKKIYASVLLALLGAQIIVVDSILSLYAWKGVHWKVDPVVVDVWLSATVVEVIAVVLVVTQHLFPKRDSARGVS
jgi:hypothetical protein